MAAADVKVVITESPIVPFQGLVNGQLPQGVEDWIDSIEAHLNLTRIADPVYQLQVAKFFIDYVEGDAGTWLRATSFTSCKTWDEFKVILRWVYGTESHLDEVLALRSILKLTEKKGLSLTEHTLAIADKLHEWHSKLATSSWVTGENINTRDVCRLLQLALMTSLLPDSLVSCFDVEFDKSSTELTVINQVKKHMSECPDLDPTLVPNFEHSFVKQSVASTSNPQQVNPVNSTNQSIRCYNCNCYGHYKGDCKARYCGYHNSCSHSYQNCKSRLNSRPGNNMRKSRNNNNGGSTGNNFSNRR